MTNFYFICKHTPSSPKTSQENYFLNDSQDRVLFLKIIKNYIKNLILKNISRNKHQICEAHS